MCEFTYALRNLTAVVLNAFFFFFVKLVKVPAPGVQSGCPRRRVASNPSSDSCGLFPCFRRVNLYDAFG